MLAEVAAEYDFNYQQAFSHHGTPEIMNTDQGSQFATDEFVQTVKNQGCKLSMDGRGAWRDNVIVEITEV